MDTYIEEEFHFRTVNIHVSFPQQVHLRRKEEKFLKIERRIKKQAEPFHSYCIHIVRLHVNAQLRIFSSGSTALPIRTPSYRNAGHLWWKSWIHLN